MWEAGVSKKKPWLPAQLGITRATIADVYKDRHNDKVNEDYEAERVARGLSEESDEIGAVPHDPAKCVSSDSD